MNGVSALIKDTPCEDTAERRSLWPGKWIFPRQLTCQYTDLGLPSPRIVRNQLLLSRNDPVNRTLLQ